MAPPPRGVTEDDSTPPHFSTAAIVMAMAFLREMKYRRGWNRDWPTSIQTGTVKFQRAKWKRLVPKQTTILRATLQPLTATVVRRKTLQRPLTKILPTEKAVPREIDDAGSALRFTLEWRANPIDV
jgi:hypothetical protein